MHDLLLLQGKEARRLGGEMLRVLGALPPTDLSQEGEGLDEVGLGPNGKSLVRVEPRYFRPAEVEYLLGDPSKARDELGWTPETDFKALVDMMVDADLESL